MFDPTTKQFKSKLPLAQMAHAYQTMQNTPLATVPKPSHYAEAPPNEPPPRRRISDNETILIVDDVPENLSVLGELLQSAGYRVKVANTGQTALNISTQQPKPSLILLDVMMPGMDGHQVLKKLRSNMATQDIPVIFLTAMDAAVDEERGFDAGIADYIIKPIKPSVVLARVRNQLLVRRARHWLQDQNSALEFEIERRMRENAEIQEMSIRALAHIAETRDNETGFHIKRTQSYVRELALRLTPNPRFTKILTPVYINALAQSAPLHDIGKVGIPDSILLKPGKLDADEWVIMKTHTTLGGDALERAQNEVNNAAGFLTQAREIARSHHERWDGTGYPDALAGDDIPIAARLMALADVFDALISKRCYKAAIAFDEVRKIIQDGRGSHFDPDIADIFLDGFDDFVAIALRIGVDN